MTGPPLINDCAKVTYTVIAPGREPEHLEAYFTPDRMYLFAPMIKHAADFVIYLRRESHGAVRYEDVRVFLKDVTEDEFYELSFPAVTEMVQTWYREKEAAEAEAASSTDWKVDVP